MLEPTRHAPEILVALPEKPHGIETEQAVGEDDRVLGPDLGPPSDDSPAANAADNPDAES
jgi:hypothetical protein